MAEREVDFKCDFCGISPRTLYEGWFRTSEHFNPYAQGTASAGVVQLRRACKKCTEEAIQTGLACAKEVPNEECAHPVL